MKTLAERLDESADAWRPEPGDKLIGTVVGFDQRTSSYDDTPYPVVTVDIEDGSTEKRQPIAPGTEKAWHAYHTVPRNELSKLRPQVGERLGVAYYGKGPKSYERYRVIVDRPKAQINWDAIPSGDQAVDDERGERSANDTEGGDDDEPLPTHNGGGE
jgi:hypothetical protein